MTHEELLDVVEGRVFELLSQDDPQKREAFIQDLLKAGYNEELVRLVSKSLLKAKAQLKDINQCRKQS